MNDNCGTKKMEWELNNIAHDLGPNNVNDIAETARSWIRSYDKQGKVVRRYNYGLSVDGKHYQFKDIRALKKALGFLSSGPLLMVWQGSRVEFFAE